VEDLFTGLNPEQTEAVKHEDGPALVVAGPGSGKTRVLTHHAAYLISKGTKPENVLLVTFTNKAAGEMRTRISQLLTNNFQQPTTLPWSGTFHSICSRILRRDGKHIGVAQNFVIFDDSDGKAVIKKAVKDLKLDGEKVNPGAILGAISSAKSELLGPKEYAGFAHGRFYQNAAKIFPKYQEYLRKSGALDFDDLLCLTVELFRKNPEILSKYQNLFKYVLIDEYQDTNKAQYVFSKLLSDAHKNIFVVGDMSQAIYSFRGADYRNILNFERDFPNAKIYKLSQNYRSTEKIVEAARNVITNNKNHIPLDLWTNNRGGEKINLYEATNEIDEANYIVQTILNEQPTHNLQLTALNRFAVLYRTNAQSRTIEEIFLHQGIPYILVGGTRFYERKEIKDVLSLLRYLQNPNDFVSSERIEKIGRRFFKKYEEWLNVLGGSKEQILKLSGLEILDLVLENCGYLDTFDKKNEEDLERIENIKELRSVAAAFGTLTEFLENVQLVQQEYLVSDKGRLAGSGSGNAITLMTLHSAKGLEFPTVFMVGMEEGLFPHSRALLDPTELEEERRLCYVGITRSMENLHLTYARSRFYFGIKQSGIISRFVSEIPGHLLEYKFTDNLLYD
jgi:DNA helicase-2/ATP-dependent DNA helicase PcrA